MQKFSEFLSDYKAWKKSNHKNSKLTRDEVKGIREAYSKMNSKSLKESKKDLTFAEEIAKYAKFKEQKTGNKNVTYTERKAIHEAYMARKNGKTEMKESTKEQKSIKGFSECVTSFREWKKANKGTSRLSEQEKRVLKERYFGKAKKEEKPVESKKSAIVESKNSKFDEAIASFKEWKKANCNTEEITESEKNEVIKGVMIDGIKTKLSEAKKSLRTARKHLIEGDVMDAATATQDAGAAYAGAADMANQVQAGDGVIPPAPVPQEVIDEVAQIKASIDSLATELGINSPVDLNANVEAGIPAVTGASDPNAVGEPQQGVVDPNAQAPLPESISTIKSRLAEREAKLNSGKNFVNPIEAAVNDNKNLQEPAVGVDKENTESQLKEPSAKELAKGTDKDVERWPNEEIKEPKDTEVRVKESLDENGAFNWEKFLSANKDLYK